MEDISKSRDPTASHFALSKLQNYPIDEALNSMPTEHMNLKTWCPKVNMAIWFKTGNVIRVVA